MFKRILFSAVLVLFALSLFSASNVAFAVKVKNKVTVNRGGKTINLQDKTPLMSNDLLESKEDSYALVKFVDGGASLKLFPNSVVKINAQKEDGKLAKRSILEKGNLYSKIEKKMGVYEVETPTTVASVKGTEFFVVITDKGETILYTFEGVVELKHKQTGDTFQVGAHQKATTDGTNTVVDEIKPGDLSKDVLDQTNADLQSNNLDIELKNSAGEVKKIKIKLK